MSIVARTPKNENFLSKNRFKIVFPRAPHLEYFTRGITLPSLTVPPVKQATPFNTLWVTGVETDFEPLTLNIICDEDMMAWQEMHDWVVGASFPRSFNEYVDVKKIGLYADMHVLLISNANVPTFEFKFKKSFPISLGSIDMSTDDDGVEQVYFPITFRYDDYEIRRIKIP